VELRCSSDQGLHRGGDHRPVAVDLLTGYPPEEVAAGKPELELEAARSEGRFEDEGWRILRAKRPSLRVFYMSGYTEDAIIHHGVLTADLDFIEKPLTAAPLVAKVRIVLERPSSDRTDAG
jgi:hypothetical protein